VKPTCLKNNSHWLFAVLLSVAVFASCTNMKKVAYINNISDTEINNAVFGLEPVIQKNDLLSITVSSPNATASQPFNTVVNVSTQTLGYTATQAAGYLVDRDGYIDLPMLGRIKAAGLTKHVLKENITKVLVDNKYLLFPIVNVRYLNFKVTVLGEVAHPMVVNVPDEKINILEALGFAGDLTIYARRDNIALIREEQGKRIVRRLDLNSGNLLTSPYYYLLSGDIIYVEPNKAKVSSASNARTWIPVALSTLGLAVILADRLKN
jgi:polysaccharide biosynthesis/export protein